MALFLFGSGPLFAADKSYSINSVNIGATINADGSMKVVESRQYDFNGSYTFAYLYINKSGELVICFDKYEVGPGAMGLVEFTIPKDIIKPLMN